MQKVMFEYVWENSNNVFSSKIKLFDLDKLPNDFKDSQKIEELPEWYFVNNKKEFTLKPCKITYHPFYATAFTVLCDVYDEKGVKVKFNDRYEINEVSAMYKEDEILLCVTEFVKRDGKKGVDTTRQEAEDFLNTCVATGLNMSEFGEFQPNEWSYKIGPSLMVDIVDQLQIARWIEQRMSIKSHNKKTVIEFSTGKMRQENGIVDIKEAQEKVEDSYVTKNTVTSGKGYLNSVVDRKASVYKFVQKFVEMVCNN